MAVEPLKFEYDQASDVLTVEGVPYSGGVFRQLGGAFPIGAVFQIHHRTDNGQVWLTLIPPGSLFIFDRQFE